MKFHVPIDSFLLRIIDPITWKAREGWTAAILAELMALDNWIFEEPGSFLDEEMFRMVKIYRADVTRKQSDQYEAIWLRVKKTLKEQAEIEQQPNLDWLT